MAKVMGRSRYQPMSRELGGYFKTAFIIWIACWVAILFLAGVSWWSFFGAMLLAVPFTILIFIVFLALTGVNDKMLRERNKK